MSTTDWYAWHEPYADSNSPLSRRLRLIQQHITSWLDERTDPSLTILSLCAGQGRDLLEVLAERPDAVRVRAHLVESDQRNVIAATAMLDAARLPNVTVLHADAGSPSSYVGTVPADLVLLAGLFGNIVDGDVKTTINALPQLCAAGATVIWTRSRRAPDLTPTIRGWFGAAGFVERAFHAPDDVAFSVGVHHFVGQPRPLHPHGTLFRFVDRPG